MQLAIVATSWPEMEKEKGENGSEDEESRQGVCIDAQGVPQAVAEALSEQLFEAVGGQAAAGFQLE